MNKTGAQLILEERDRQITEEGWTLGHDARLDSGDLVKASIAYCLSGMYPFGTDGAKAMIEKARKNYWPDTWSLAWFKPKSRLRDLVRAGALIAAEIDKLQGNNES